MATTAALMENSHQGINSKIPPCIRLGAWLSLNLRLGCGHAYDETPVDLVVYVRNDPVNLIDPDGKEYVEVEARWRVEFGTPEHMATLEVERCLKHISIKDM